MHLDCVCIPVCHFLTTYCAQVFLSCMWIVSLGPCPCPCFIAQKYLFSSILNPNFTYFCSITSVHLFPHFAFPTQPLPYCFLILIQIWSYAYLPWLYLIILNTHITSPLCHHPATPHPFPSAITTNTNAVPTTTKKKEFPLESHQAFSI